MIKNVLIFSALLLVGLFFQSAVVGRMMPAAVLPDIIVVLIVYVSLRYRTVRGLLGVYALGLLSDLAGGVYLGPNAAAAVVVFVCSGLLANRVYAERVFAVVVICFFCSICKSLTVLTLIWSYTNTQSEVLMVVKTVLFEALATAFVAPIILKMLQLFTGHGSRANPSSQRSAVSATGTWGSVRR